MGGVHQYGYNASGSSTEFEALLMAWGILLFNDLMVLQSHAEREFVPKFCQRMQLRYFLDTGRFRLLQ